MGKSLKKRSSRYFSNSNTVFNVYLPKRLHLPTKSFSDGHYTVHNIIIMRIIIFATLIDIHMI